jgi:uncharacterized protein DUF6538
MKTVSGDQHLLRRKGVYYYRRRVPIQLIEKLGRKFVQLTLHTTSSSTCLRQPVLALTGGQGCPASQKTQ